MKGKKFPGIILYSAALLALFAGLAAWLWFREDAEWICTDVCTRDWFAPELRQVLHAGLMDGGEDLPFRPAERMTRAMTADALYRFAGSPEAGYTGTFDDLDQEAWYVQAVCWAAETGIVQGGGEFQPDTPVTREQFCCFLHSYAAAAGAAAGDGAPLDGYYDAAEVSPAALSAVSWAEQYNLLDCAGDAGFRPQGTLSRAEAAAAFSRCLRGVFADNEGYIPAADPPPWLGFRQLKILMYHNVVPDDEPGGDWTVTVSQLREDLQCLVDHGYSFYLPGELARGTRIARKSVMLTFDDGYRSNYDLAFPLLQEFGAKAVIAPVVSYVREDQSPLWLTWDMCREMADSGLVELGSHTYDLHRIGEYDMRRAPDETPEQYAQRVFPDLEQSITLLESRTGQKVYYLAYPNGATDALAEDFVRTHFDMSVTTQFGMRNLRHGLYDLPRININTSLRVAEVSASLKRPF